MLTEEQTMTLVRQEDAIARLQKLIRSRQELIMAYKRKKSWRASEIAMACGNVRQDIEALHLAVKALQEVAALHGTDTVNWRGWPIKAPKAEQS